MEIGAAGEGYTSPRQRSFSFLVMYSVGKGQFWLGLVIRPVDHEEYKQSLLNPQKKKSYPRALPYQLPWLLQLTAKSAGFLANLPHVIYMCLTHSSFLIIRTVLRINVIAISRRLSGGLGRLRSLSCARGRGSRYRSGSREGRLSCTLTKIRKQCYGS